MKKTCRVCTDTFDYCAACSLTKNSYKNAGYCGENCYNISMTLQRYGCHVATAAETIEALEPYNISNMSLQPKIEKYYKGIVDETKAQMPKFIEEVATFDGVEVVVNDEDTTISENE